jgi:hypothetical protein
MQLRLGLLDEQELMGIVHSSLDKERQALAHPKAEIRKIADCLRPLIASFDLR